MPSPVLSAAQALTQAQTLLAEGQREAALPLLELARADAGTLLAAHRIFEAQALPGNFTDMMGLDCTIAEKDDIFQFFVRHPSSLNPLRDYFADGWRTLSELMLLLERARQPLLDCQQFLEFASGHGRFTRHLVKALGAERITVSDVVPDAVAFSQAQFGVRGVLSASRPEALRMPQTYDQIFVLSLFSHLPRSTWTLWLRALYDCVAPGGLLVFSAHGERSARLNGVQFDADGFFFAPSSESQAIDPNEYGTAFTAEAFVHREIEQALGSDRLALFQPAHFWGHQDAYVLRRPA